MAADLEEQSRSLEEFIVHDIRRTCRTKFSALPIEDVARELLLAHTRPELHRTYDLHKYQEEKAHALTLWHARLKAMIEPKPENVLPFTATKAV
jgi:hypothetical protein